MMNGTNNVQIEPDNSHLKFYLAVEEECDFAQSDEMTLLDNQVAGHFTGDKENIGMFKCGGTVLKPVTRRAQRAQPCRETCFYRTLAETSDPSLLQMRKFVPKYYGNRTVRLEDGREVECMVLQDLTKGFKEPCIMDVKIGKRTWDPDATYEKMASEQQKYQDTKRDVGFCIPGFQVYKLSNGKLRKYGKDYGKKLNKETLIDAFRIFLNADSSISRSLLVQLLVNLWQIQDWARHQHGLRLYSSSLLLIYDAKRLRQTVAARQHQLHIERETAIPIPTASLTGSLAAPLKSHLTRSASLYRPLSLAVLHDKESVRTGFSGQLTKDGPILKCPISPNRTSSTLLPPTLVDDSLDHRRRRPVQSAPNLKRMHSFQNNYDKELHDIKAGYHDILDDLIWEEKTQLWATVRLIDFAHVYETHGQHSIDENYLNGLENLVKILEGFLEQAL